MQGPRYSSCDQQRQHMVLGQAGSNCQSPQRNPRLPHSSHCSLTDTKGVLELSIWRSNSLEGYRTRKMSEKGSLVRAKNYPRKKDREGKQVSWQEKLKMRLRHTQVPLHNKLSCFLHENCILLLFSSCKAEQTKGFLHYFLTFGVQLLLQMLVLLSQFQVSQHIPSKDVTSQENALLVKNSLKIKLRFHMIFYYVCKLMLLYYK